MSKGFFSGSTTQTKAPPRGLPACGACALFKKCHTPKIGIQGNGRARVLIVGTAPSQHEDRSGRLFKGPAWSRLRRVLKTCGLDIEEDCWLMNALACHTKTPTSAQVGYCRPNVKKAIESLQPAVIITLGQAAVASVIGPVWGEDCGQMARWAGWCIPCQTLNAWVCPTYHPAALDTADDGVLDQQFEQHIVRALAQPGIPYPEGPPNYAQNVRHVTCPHKAAAWLRRAAKQRHGAIAWDYETNKLKPDADNAKIVSCAVAYGRGDTPEKCIAFPWHGEAIKAMGELLRSPVPKIASNLKFEDRWTRKEFGHRVRGWAWDTMLSAHVCDNRPAITSVKFQAYVRLGAPVWNDKIERFLKSKTSDGVNAVGDCKVDDLLRYNGLDAWLEFLVATDQMSELGIDRPW